MGILKRVIFLATIIFVLLILQKVGKSLSYDWDITLVQNEADGNGDGIPDVISNFTPISSTYLKIYVNDTIGNETEYKWKAVICNISEMEGSYMQHLWD